MIHQYRVTRFLFLLLTVICSMKAFAGVEPYQNQLKGTIKKGDTLVVKDEKFRNTYFDWNEITNRTVKNFVSLQITYDTPVVLNKAFTCELDLKVEYYSSPDQAEPITINSVKLKVNFSPETGATYKAKDVYSFSNGYLVKITVNNISSPEMGDKIPPVLQLTNQVVIDRQYVFHPEKPVYFTGSIITNNTTAPAKNARMMAMSMAPNTIDCYMLHLDWNSIQGAEEYDVEWAVFDQGTEKQTQLQQLLANQSPGSTDVLDAFFRNNSTRITTDAHSYDVSMVYNAKYIMVRIRQVQYNNGYRDEADWNYQPNGQYAIWEIPCWHEEKLNWQYAATFAEEGKKKEIVSYFDGSLRSRQAVTINNSDDVAVVQETVYDEFGRAAANILPAPTVDDKFHFYPKFNRNLSNESYDYRSLSGATNAETCESTIGKLSDDWGAANYYSAKNAFLALDNSDPRYRKFNKYLPQSGGYPISVAQFTNDNTGRVRVQGGLGPLFQPGASDRHATKYYYGKPESWELDRLFGNDVGYANHYQKNMIVDPNGQISVNYMNASGKTIATALTGKTPNGMDALPSKPEEKPETFTILHPQQFVFDATALTLNAKTTYLSSVANANATFNYNIQELVYNYQGTSKQGTPFQVCSNCYYDLTIRVTNDCGYPVYSTTNAIQIGTKTGDCNRTPQTYQPFNCTFKEVGEYFISFELKLSKKVMEDYTNAYIKQRDDNHSLKTELEFILDYLNNTDFNGCFNECNTCEAALGSEAQFTQAVTGKFVEYGYAPTSLTPEINSFISGLYNSLHTQCMALRATCMVSSCSKYEKEMLDDVSPGGQYALFAFDPFTPLESEINVLLNHFRDVFPVQPAGSATWNTEAFTDENGNTISPYDGSFTLEMLVKYWKDEWGTRFLQYHPEKCKLDFCNANSNYIMWDDQVQQFVNKATDIPGIPGNNGTIYSYTDGAWLVAIDPFFQTGPGTTYRQQFISDLKNYSRDIMNVNVAGAQIKGATQVIDYLLYCADLDGSTNAGIVTDSWNGCAPVTSCRVPNREWDQYKDLYFQLKQKYYQLARNSSCAAYCPVGKPYTIPGSCATTNDFGIEKAIGNATCGQGTQAIRITYAKGVATRPMTVDLYYPGEFLSLPAKPTSVTFAIGESEKIICVTNTILVKSIKIKAVTCTGDTDPTNCTGNLTGRLNFTGNVLQLASNKFQEVTTTGVTNTYTIVPGRQDQPPADATYCPDGTIIKKDFYTCFRLYMPNSPVPFQYKNIWVIGCSKDECANAPVYNVDNQLDSYRFYKNGFIYYVKLSAGGGATPPCAYTPNYKPCVKVQVGSNAPLVFTNAMVISCQACPAGSTTDISSKGKIGFNPLIYVGGDDYRYYVYPLTSPGYVPPSTPCNTTPVFYTCLRFTGEVNDTYYNATVIKCPPPADVCPGTQPVYPIRMIADNVWLFDWGTMYLFNNGNATDPLPSPCQSYQPWPVSCLKIRYNGIIINYTNIWEYDCHNAQSARIAENSVVAPLSVAISCPEAYAYKKSRFPDIDISNLSSQDLVDIQNENNTLINTQIKTSCEAQADKWMSQLSDCLASYPQGVQDQLRAKLIEVCTNGGDVDHPYGSSTVATGYTGSGYTSFKQAIQSVLGIGALTMTCNPWLIDEPHPYEPKQQAVSKILSTTNASLCDKLQQLRSGYSGSDFFGYLKGKYGDAMNLTSAQLDMLTKSCNNCRYILEDDIPLPVFMEPGTVGCITKADYDAAKNALIAEMGGNLDVTHPNYPDVLTNYLNHRWGFSMAYFRYQDYESQLQSTPSAILCNNIPYTQVEVDQYVCLKSLVESAIINGRRDRIAYIEEEKRKFRMNYVSACAQTQGSAQITTVQQTYHYTLYYYDQAGNLIRTVSPEGIRPLSDEELPLVDQYRKQGEILDCSGFNLAATESKSVALSKISAALQSGSGKSLELWLNGSGPTRHVRFVTPDNRYFYQAAIANNTLWVELYSLQPGINGDIAITLSNNIVADISSIPLQDWSHLVIEQATDFAGGQWTVYLDNHKLTLLPGPSQPGYPFDWEISAGFTLPADVVSDLRHIRLYDRLMSDPEIHANYVNQCRGPEGQLSVSTSPLIVWGRFNLPTICNNTTSTRTVGNRGALQALGNLNGSQTSSFSSVANTFTVEMWVNPQGIHEIDAESQTGTAGMSGQKYAIYPTQYSAASGAAGMGISVGTNGISVYENADSYMPPLLVWPGSITGWHHIAVVYNNKVPSLYIDGQFVKSGLASTKATINPSYNFCTGPYGTMIGGLDEVRIWNIARTQPDINADYRRSIAPSTNGLVAYWPMSREDGSDAYDVTCAHIPVHLTSNYVWTTNPTAPVADVVPLDYAVKGIYPRHRLTSSYAFNSSNNTVQEKSPDGGTTYFWYDILSRMIASQNEEQRTPHDNINPNRYSYTEYDPIGRVVEVGEKSNVQTLPVPGFLLQSEITTFNTTGAKTQITQTVYDQIPTASNGVQTGLLQENLRKRVSATLYKEIYGGPVLQASYYSFDLQGNVKTFWQQVDGLALKRTDYEYDLISGKTNFLRYQHGEKDQFYYAYKHDAENQLIEAYTGTEALVGQRGSTLLNGQLDAFYQYYLHGPLARVELGQNKVQGLDYAYTLQGWLKGINGHKLNATEEMGQDGAVIARDAMAYTLGYYQGDYQPIGGINVKAFSMPYLSQPGDVSGNDLFNGNASNTTVALSKFRNGDPVGYSYRYDQLNRLKAMRFHPLSASTTDWDNSTKAPDDTYAENFTYDGNGNISTLKRNGIVKSANTEMDNLTYNYTRLMDPVNNLEYKIHNQLQQVSDVVPEGKYSQGVDGVDDFDNQSNYQYDKIGNLVKDQTSNITTDITWTANGKTRSIIKHESNKTTTITYSYNGAGNRVKKEVTVLEGGTTTTNVTWYTLDAHGNNMAVYTDKYNDQTGVWWKEQYLYGSKRLGLWAPRINIATTNGTSEWSVSGKKEYELSNHLGNVLTTISDSKTGIDAGSDGTIDYYEANVITASDYYSFGMQMPGRIFNSGNYRYGFNGQEADKEIYGQGNAYTAEFWEYDPRIGRRWNVDPHASSYPHTTPYSFVENNPINRTDPTGGDWIVSTVKNKNGSETVHITLTAAVLNSSSNNKIIMASFASALSSQIKSSYSISYTRNDVVGYQTMGGGLDGVPGKKVPIYKAVQVNVVVNVQVTVITKESQLKSNEHLIQIMDHSTLLKLYHDKIYGHGDFDGSRVRINANKVANMLNGKDNNTLPHELGHTFGLHHIDQLEKSWWGSTNSQYYAPQKQKANSNNAMFSGTSTYMNDATSTQINGAQIEFIRKRYNAGKLNKH